MSRKLDLQLKAIRKKYGNRVAREFAAAVQDIASQVKISTLEKHIASGNIEAALTSLDIDPAAFGRVTKAVADAYDATGLAVASGVAWRGMDGQRVVIRWDMANPRAEQWVANSSSRLITNLTNTMRSNVRSTILSGYELGQGPRTIALDIAGRVGPSGRRTGGIIGLSDPFSNHVQSMRSRLRSGDLRAVLTMTKRDRRADPAILRHIKNGTTPSAAEINKWSGRYADRLLILRGETIARTETGAAVEAANLEAYKQWQDKTGVPDQFVKRVWKHAGGGKLNRDWHQDMHNNSAQGLKTPFVTPHGASMMHPLDTSLGAGAEEVANCRCSMQVEIDHAGIANS